MTRAEFEREIFGDTSPRTEIDYAYHRRLAAHERRVAIAAFPGQARSAIAFLWEAMSRLRPGFVPLRPNVPRHQDLWHQDPGSA
ncbi:MAG: hypothetical protein NTV73_00150 [Hyphomicrobiales bacterium]|nr:hypothetical protein [Hyphomicrobiales bacterium]